MKKILLPLGWFIGVIFMGIITGFALIFSAVWHGGMESFRFHRSTSGLRDYLRGWDNVKKHMDKDIAN